MILTITLNPALDKILILNDFATHRLHRLGQEEISILSPGGKGVNIALTLKMLGNEVIASGFAAGHSGHMLCDEIRQTGITTSFIFTEGLTRTNISILDLQHETLTEINDFGQEVSADDIDFFIENFEQLLKRVKIVVIAGSLPKGVQVEVYKRLIAIAQNQGKKVLVHTSPDYTKELLSVSPFMICPDMRSKHELFGKHIDGIANFLEAGRKVLTQSSQTEFVLFIHRIENVVAVTREKSYIIRPENLKIANMLGYGDAYLAGFIHSYLQDRSLTETLRFASAAGLTNVEDLYKEIRDVTQIKKNLSRISLEEVE